MLKRRLHKLDRWPLRWDRWRRSWSRSEWIARWLGPASPDLSGSEPGLVLIQIDALSRRELERALARGRMPFLRRLLRREKYRLHDFYSGLPSTTFAVQAELFYGQKTAVPAVGFRIRRTGEVGMILDPEAAEEREAEIAAENGEPLLKGGTAYGDALHGGAAEPHFCAATLTLRSILSRIRPRLWPVLILLYFPTFLRILWDSFLAVFTSLSDAISGMRRGHRVFHELAFIRNRVLVDVVLREWQTYCAQIDALRGFPVIHVNYLGYDEKAHRRGPKTAFAHRSLRSIDRSIRRIWKAAVRSSQRDYELWIYADHGQEQTIPYPRKFDREVQDAIGAVAQRLLNEPVEDKPRFEMAAIGPVGYVYPWESLDPLRCAEFAEALVQEARIPTVLYEDEQGRVRFRNVAGKSGVLPDQVAELAGPDHPFLKELGEDLVRMCHHPEAGQVVLLGWCPGDEPVSFVFENGAHGGPGVTETHAFALLPADVSVPACGYFRALELGKRARRRLGRSLPTPRPQPILAGSPESDTSAARSSFGESRTESDGRSIRVVSYNVHSCVGMDGKLSPQRIARVIAQCNPDFVALQELDVGRKRTLGRDQAEEIAVELSMEVQFHPAIRLAEEQYGDAILSRWPLKLMRAGLLPGVTPNRRVEPRGALWVAARIDGQIVHLVNTHLGLEEQERWEQVEALLGADWLGNAACQDPVILCGDMNFGPRSRAYQRLTQQLQDTQLPSQRGRAHATFPSLWPVVRIDHIFVKGAWNVLQVETPRTRLAMQASDHLPLVVELQLPGVGEVRRNHR